jgi:Na+/H+ antiporter NhaD/arsenite permease-like protein
MMPPRRKWARRMQRLHDEWLLVLFAALTLLLAVLDPRPLDAYWRWLQWPTLAGLLGLLVAIQGIRDSGLVQHAAAALTARTHSLRSLGLLLVTATALLSMVLTNDVSLFLIVPLTMALGGSSNLPVARMVVLEALAVNAGSTLSPIGNPQNLLLWQHSQLSFLQFAWGMLPAAAVMLALVVALTLYWVPKGPVTLMTPEHMHAVTTSRHLGAWSPLALLTMVLAMEYGHATWGAALLLAAFAVCARSSLLRVDWPLLLTFAAIFLALRHVAELPAVQHLLAMLDFDQPLVLYASGIVAAQLISNVPATVLLLNHTPDVMALAVAVNVGGFGLAIGSLANLIALRLLRDPHGLRALHRISVPFLLICAPLVYLLLHWLHG